MRCASRLATSPAPAPVSAPAFAHLPASRSGLRHFSPKELASELAAYGVQLGERAIQSRCNLPEGDPLRIATNPNFPGRHFILERELARLLGATEAAA
jgi:hypothetical protein